MLQVEFGLVGIDCTLLSIRIVAVNGYTDAPPVVRPPEFRVVYCQVGFDQVDSFLYL